MPHHVDRSDPGRVIDRRRLIALGGASVTGAALLATTGRHDLAAQTPAATPGTTRTIEHALGTTDVPTEPNRIAVLDQSLTLASLLSVGVVPALALRQDLGRPPFPAFIPAELTDSIETIDATSGEFSLESVVAFAPDLIVAAAGSIAEQYDLLARVAPTIGLQYTLTDPYGDLRTAADVVGKTDRAEQVVTDVEGRLRIVADEVDIGSVTLMAVRGDSSLRFFSDLIWIGRAVTALGGSVTPMFDDLPGSLDIPEDSESVSASQEFLMLADGDAMLLLQQDSPEVRPALETARQSPLWQELPAVRNDRVLVVDNFAAQGLSGRWGYDHLVDQLRQFFKAD